MIIQIQFVNLHVYSWTPTHCFCECFWNHQSWILRDPSKVMLSDKFPHPFGPVLPTEVRGRLQIHRDKRHSCCRSDVDLPAASQAPPGRNKGRLIPRTVDQIGRSSWEVHGHFANYGIYVGSICVTWCCGIYSAQFGTQFATENGRVIYIYICIYIYIISCTNWQFSFVKLLECKLWMELERFYFWNDFVIWIWYGLWVQSASRGVRWL